VVIDGGDHTCVALLLELRGHLTRLPPRTVVHLIAELWSFHHAGPVWGQTEGRTIPAARTLVLRGRGLLCGIRPVARRQAGEAAQGREPVFGAGPVSLDPLDAGVAGH
jgi:hypothetical protein